MAGGWLGRAGRGVVGAGTWVCGCECVGTCLRMHARARVRQPQESRRPAGRSPLPRLDEHPSPPSMRAGLCWSLRSGPTTLRSCSTCTSACRPCSAPCWCSSRRRRATWCSRSKAWSQAARRQSTRCVISHAACARRGLLGLGLARLRRRAAPLVSPYPGTRRGGPRLAPPTKGRAGTLVSTTWPQELPGEGGRVCPEVDANILSRLTFSWMGPLMREGYREPLTFDKMWTLPPGDRSAVLDARFLRLWAAERFRHPEHPSLVGPSAGREGRLRGSPQSWGARQARGDRRGMLSFGQTPLACIP